MDQLDSISFPESFRIVRPADPGYSFEAALMDSILAEESSEEDGGAAEDVVSESPSTMTQDLSHSLHLHDSSHSQHPPPHHRELISPSITTPASPNQTPPLTACASSNSKKRKKKEQSKMKKKQKRQEEKDSKKDHRYEINIAAHQRHFNRSSPTNVSFPIENLPIGSTGFIGLRGVSGPIHGIEAMRARYPDFEVIEWNGVDSKPIVAQGRIICILAGRPRSKSWDDACQAAFSKLKAARTTGYFPPQALDHRRGRYATLTTGISYGGGQTKPKRLAVHPKNVAIVEGLLGDKSINRIAAFSNGCFAAWAPKLYTHYERCMAALLTDDSTLKTNWSNSIWAGVGFNCGPQTVTKKHTDDANLAFGLCSVTPLGNFDHSKGGHLVLWSLKLIIQFPAGSTILLPSSTIPHSNIPILDSEERCSITQFSAGGLFRWVDYKCQPAAAYMANQNPQDEQQRRKERREFGLSLFSTLDSLKEDQKARASSL